jgi:hypothetical protein
MTRTQKPGLFNTPRRDSPWTHVQKTVKRFLNNTPQPDKIAQLSRPTTPVTQAIKDSYLAGAFERQMQHAMHLRRPASQYTLDTLLGPVKVVGWELGHNQSLGTTYYWLIYTDDPSWGSSWHSHLESLLTYYPEHRIVLLSDHDHTMKRVELEIPTLEGHIYLGLISDMEPVRQMELAALDAETNEDALQGQRGTWKDWDLPGTRKNRTMAELNPALDDSYQEALWADTVLRKRMADVHNVFDIPEAHREADLKAFGIHPNGLGSTRRKDQALGYELDQVLLKIADVYKICPGYLEAEDDDTEARIVPWTWTSSNLAEHALHFAEACRAARTDKENVQAWLIRSPCDEDNSDIADVGIVWSRNHPHVEGATVYLRTQMSLWNPGGNGPEWGWEPSERIEFKAFCLLVQASGLPFTGLDCPESAQEMLMPDILRHHNTKPLDLAALLNEHDGVDETYMEAVGVTITVADTFEKFKNVAPEAFQSLHTQNLQ